MSDVLTLSQVRVPGTARSKDDAIREAGEILVDAGAVDPDYIDSMFERERSVSTYMGNYLAINSRSDEPAVAAAIALADIVTTAVGPTILKFVAPVIADGLRGRPDGAAPLAVMACENAINATDTLAGHIRSLVTDEEWPALAAKAVFANTAVDRIVPPPPPDARLGVPLQNYFEWA